MNSTIKNRIYLDHAATSPIKNRIYLDHAATSPISPKAFIAMLPYLQDNFGNPSSIYSYGREARLVVEESRKKVATCIGAHPSEVFFTSGGTESINTVIAGAVQHIGCKVIVATPIEHPATLQAIQYWQEQKQVHVEWLELNKDGQILEDACMQKIATIQEKCLFVCMHTHNELGNIISMELLRRISHKENILIFMDATQGLSYNTINVKQHAISFLVGSAHKLGGAKGTGLLYVSKQIVLQPMLMGGGQERGLRGGTENVAGIVAFAVAIEEKQMQQQANRELLWQLKQYIMNNIKKKIPQAFFLGDVEGSSAHHIVCLGLNKTEQTDLLVHYLDIHQICVSSGSACSSGTVTQNKVISWVYPDKAITPIRISLSTQNTKEEIDKCITIMADYIHSYSK